MLAEIAEEQGFSATYDDIAELTEDGIWLHSLRDITYYSVWSHAFVCQFSVKSSMKSWQSVDLCSKFTVLFLRQLLFV